MSEPNKSSGKTGFERDFVRENVPPGEEATLWDITHPHVSKGHPYPHTDARLWRHEEDGRVSKVGEEHGIPVDPSDQ